MSTLELIGKKANVLDDIGYVQLLDVMPHPLTGVSGDLAIVNAARVSYLGESKGDTKDKKLLFYLMRNGHTSPFEQIEFKFKIHAPVVTFWQLVRHRSAHINMSSGRYTEFKEDQFYIPKDNEWRKQSDSNKQGSSDEIMTDDDFTAVFESSNIAYDVLMQYHSENIENFGDALNAYTALGYDIYSRMIENGAAKEQARLFLPAWGSYYTGVWKIDAHNLMHFLKLRLDEHAQYEIRVYAQAIYESFFKPMLPWTAEAFEMFVLNKEK